MKKRIQTFLIVLIFFVGLSVLIYPTLSNWLNERNQSKTIQVYEDVSKKIEKKDFSRIFAEAAKYNDEVRHKRRAALLDPRIIKTDPSCLDVTGSGVIGYITIPKIKVNLPVYLGTDPAVLQVAVGHVDGTSLPIGGRGTHAVLSAHRGLPSAELFSGLDQMEVGDEFEFTILGDTLIYRTDQIKVVLPEEIKDLDIDPKKDYMSLLTCTPYGVNSHRLIVRGVRVGTADAAELAARADNNPKPETPAADEKDNEAFKFHPFMLLPVIIIAFILLLTRKNKNVEKR